MFCPVFAGSSEIENITIEERVVVLEAEMSAVLIAIGDINVDIDLLNSDGVIQNERIFLLEKDTDDLDDNFENLEGDLLALVDTVDGE